MSGDVRRVLELCRKGAEVAAEEAAAAAATAAAAPDPHPAACATGSSSGAHSGVLQCSWDGPRRSTRQRMDILVQEMLRLTVNQCQRTAFCVGSQLAAGAAWWRGGHAHGAGRANLTKVDAVRVLAGRWALQRG